MQTTQNPNQNLVLRPRESEEALEAGSTDNDTGHLVFFFFCVVGVVFIHQTSSFHHKEAQEDSRAAYQWRELNELLQSANMTALNIDGSETFDQK